MNQYGRSYSEMTLGKFQVGDSVIVKNKGRTYSSYIKMAERLGVSHKWVCEPHQTDLENGTVGVILRQYSEIRYGNRTTFVLIDTGDREYIISDNGLALVEDSNMSEDSGECESIW